ncbi:ATP-dependent DNA ligase [Crucibulum laeve]|uniref:DNA ligase n=1 Tax=Crucibulum laeve TaxID=68775 RepID=A0A5C3MG98_9AGAR|nr:ATP-dependent DNA ligase [Crucibulum laeve]
MSKRASSTSAAMPKSKRIKLNRQSQIDSFFRSAAASPESLDILPIVQNASINKKTRSVSPKMSTKINNGVIANPALEVVDVDSIEPITRHSSVSPCRSDDGPRTDSNNTTRKRSPQKLIKNISSLDSALESSTFTSLSLDVVCYNPSSQSWSSPHVPYSFLAHILVTLSQTRSRISIMNTLTNGLRTILEKDSASLLPSIYLLSNTLSPPYSPIELGLGPTAISHAIQRISGLTPPALKKLYASLGDSGDVAFTAKSNLRMLFPHPKLQVPFVYQSLLKIAHIKGQGAVKEKEKIMEKLLVAANGEEIRYLTRTLSKNLRVGAVRTSILVALARAMVLAGASLRYSGSEHYASKELLIRIKSAAGKKSVDAFRKELDATFQRAEALIKGVYVKHPNYDHIVGALLDHGLDGLPGHVPLSVGIPLHSTLGSPLRSLEEVYERLPGLPFSAEFKYDGQRAQIHAIFQSDETVSVKIFSRHLEDMTTKYPDVVFLIKDFCTPRHNTSFILDSEIVAIDQNTGELKSFQELSNRARKDVKLGDIKVPVCVFAFDLMYLDGQSLLEQPFRKRRHMLRSHFPPYDPPDKRSAHFKLVESCESEGGKSAIQAFWKRAVESRCEGVMIKLLDHGTLAEEEKSKKKSLPATYEPDKRTAAWIKLKKDYVVGLGDSLDLVPIGAWYGNGRKASWWSPILLGLSVPNSGRVVAVCKCMSGFSDEFYKALGERYSLTDSSQTCSARPMWECDFGGFTPDVYFKPQEVWEIRGADVTLSPVSTAAQGMFSRDHDRGLSLRFPRFIRLRGDKSVDQASTPDFLIGIWRGQQQAGRNVFDDNPEELLDIDIEDSVTVSDSDTSMGSGSD